MFLIGYVSRHPKTVCAYNDELIVAKHQSMSSSANSLRLGSIQSASQLHSLLKTFDPAQKITTQSERSKTQ